jgi:hypothetical protein
MKLLIVPFLSLSTLLFLGSSTYAQHGRPAGTPGAAGSMGASGTHENSTAGGGHGSSKAMASTDPGHVLEHNSNLAGRLETLTGATSLTDLKTDASAFKNFGQFVAAAHVAKNLNITGGFAALMCDMTTKGATVGGVTSTCTNTTKMSLGKAIQTLDPHVDAKSESKKATDQANQDLKDSSGS